MQILHLGKINVDPSFILISVQNSTVYVNSFEDLF